MSESDSENVKINGSCSTSTSNSSSGLSDSDSDDALMVSQELRPGFSDTGGRDGNQQRHHNISGVDVDGDKEEFPSIDSTKISSLRAVTIGSSDVCRYENISTIALLCFVICWVINTLKDWLIDLRPCQHDNGYMDGQSQIKVHTDEWTQVHRTQSSMVVTHPSTNLCNTYLYTQRVRASWNWSVLLGLDTHLVEAQF